MKFTDNEKNSINKVTNTIKLLNEIISSNNSENKTLLTKVLSSQARLAEFEDLELNIKRCSLNSFKSYCEKYHVGGYSDVDRLRKSALNKIKTEPVSKRKNNRTIAGLESDKKDLKIENRKLKKYIIMQGILIDDLKSAISRLSSQDMTHDDRKYIISSVNKVLIDKLESMKNIGGD